MLRKSVTRAVVLLGALALSVYAAFQLSPWPSVWLIRYAFKDGADEAIASTVPLIPAGVAGQLGLSYAPDEPDAKLDLFTSASARQPMPTVVWVHGGGFVGGTRSDLSGYLKILAGKGFATVAIDYSVAPEARFPTPVRQTNLALEHLVRSAARFKLDPQRIFLAGDSAGAHIAAQTALTISDADYARRLGIRPGLERAALRGLVLYCGPYDPTTMSFQGPFASFMRTVVWSYLGTRDPHDPRLAQLAVTPHVSAAYPPTFISVGNGDPLAPQSHAFAQALRARGVEVDALFFPPDHQPALGHEYQLLLTTDAAKLALERSVAFLNAHAK